MALCPYCGKRFPSIKNKKWHGCKRAKAARHKRQLTMQREWYAKNKESLKGRLKGPDRRCDDDVPVKLYPCKRCGKKSVNRFLCSNCLIYKTSHNSSIVFDCCGIELSEIWL